MKRTRVLPAITLMLMALPLAAMAQESSPPVNAPAAAADAQPGAPPASADSGSAPAVPAAVAPAPAPKTTTVIMNTAMGEIRIALESERAPLTAANFLRYVDAKRFDNITFYRAHKVSPDGAYAIVQAGLQNNSKLIYKPIPHESPQTTGLSHVDGAISMARLDPGTATADFFITVGELVQMDGKADGSDLGYAVFGRVTAGMDVVRQMLDLPRAEDARNPVMKGQMLAVPVKVLTVRRAP